MRGMKITSSVFRLTGHRFLVSSVIVLTAMLSSPSSFAQKDPRWVSDEFEITMRRGKDTSKTIIRVIPSGTQLELLKDDPSSDYSKVRTESGIEGWVLDRYLVTRPPAKVRLPEIEARLERNESQRRKLETALASLREEKTLLQRQINQLEKSGSGLQKELDEIRRLSSDVVEVNDRNKGLQKRLTDNQLLLDELTAENGRLAARSNREWFVIGALVVIFGILIGLILPRIRWRKKSGWGEL